ncbi:hypothetical protein [Streptomyces sp. TRM68416]|uniref:hypothetical protein n=1 Tax=Streptomyces sp. TRM68416 TaxID=2758412 RepID=UPI001661CC4D|nr:hypothetical protein [Streptomyces sp. TRM68416]MBD0837821.1 hypothetical protein [Streptomyces sp. TRM68416]
MSAGMPLASAELLRQLLWFLPTWVMDVALWLIAVAVLASWVLALRRRIVRYRARRRAGRVPRRQCGDSDRRGAPR